MTGPGILFQASIFCFLLAVVLGGYAVLQHISTTLLETLVAVTGLGWIGRKSTDLKRMTAKSKASRKVTPLVQELIPQLYGEYTPYVVEAAEKLGESRDVTAVPALCAALETSVNAQKPGWRDVSAALADALASIGDGRALPLLYKLENVRGIGFIPNIRSAIARIEPHSSLLRPGSEADVAQTETLLRPLPNRDTVEPPAQLLRPSNRD